MAGKEETPKCRKKTVTRTNEMIEDLIDFIEIHPIVAFEAIYEPILTSFWSSISFAVQLYIIMQYKGQHPPLLPKMSFCLLYLPPKLVCMHQNFLHHVYTNLNLNLGGGGGVWFFSDFGGGKKNNMIQSCCHII